MSEELYTPFSIARLLDVFPAEVGRWIQNGDLKADKSGEDIKVSESDLLIFLKKNSLSIPQQLLRGTEENGKTILIVDDDESVRTAFNRAVSHEFPDSNLISAVDGFEAGHETALKKPDIVLLDIMLPGMDGFRVCSLIKKTYPSTKIIAITGFDNPEAREKMEKAGADAFLAKPVNLDDLTAKMKELLS